MDYLEACEAEVSAHAARREVERHGLRWADFTAEVGERSTYQGSEVLDWLGY